MLRENILKNTYESYFLEGNVMAIYSHRYPTPLHFTDSYITIGYFYCKYKTKNRIYQLKDRVLKLYKSTNILP